MFRLTMMLRTVALLVAAMAALAGLLAFSAAAVTAAEEKKPADKDTKAPAERVRFPAEVRGVVGAVDTAKNSITIAVVPTVRGGTEEKTFTLAKDAEVLLDEGRGRRFVYKEGKLGDLHAGAVVTLIL